jgi:hypothetical protein
MLKQLKVTNCVIRIWHCALDTTWLLDGACRTTKSAVLIFGVAWGKYTRIIDVPCFNVLFSKHFQRNSSALEKCWLNPRTHCFLNEAYSRFCQLIHTGSRPRPVGVRAIGNGVRWYNAGIPSTESVNTEHTRCGSVPSVKEFHWFIFGILQFL